jgi:hypothetical protein
MIRCKTCGTVLESKSRHDFQQCDCPNQAFVDGGGDYIRVGAMDMDEVEFGVNRIDEEIVPGITVPTVQWKSIQYGNEQE